MNDSFQENMNKAAAFQKIWMESLSKTTEAAWTSFSSGSSPPPEIMRQMRSGIFEALSRSWEEFMRSPEFLRASREWVEQAVSFRKMTNDLVARARKEAQAPSMEDIEDLMLAIRHMEKRLLNRMDELAAQLRAEKNGKAGAYPAEKPKPGGRRARTKKTVIRQAAVRRDTLKTVKGVDE